MIARALTLALLLGGLAAVHAPAAAQAPAPAPADSLTNFLRTLSDSTDAGFGDFSVAFDTTGLDTLAAHALEQPLPPPPKFRSALYPVLNYHRASGPELGAGWRGGNHAVGFLGLRGSYTTSAKLGRYEFDYRRTLWLPGKVISRFDAARTPRLGERRRLDLELSYIRRAAPFMLEHADPDAGGIGALMTGTNAQSVFERRGFSGALFLTTGDWGFHAGVQSMKEKPLPVATTFSLIGNEEDVPPNIQADEDDYTEPFGEIGFMRRDWDFAATASIHGTGDRRRLRAVLGRGWRLGSALRLDTEFEGGAAAAAAPRQRRFEIGGAKAVPSLPYGIGGTDHLLLARFELMGSMDVLKALHLPHPVWLVLQPGLFTDYGNVWDDPAGRDVVFSNPPGGGWRGAVGGGLAWRLGIPEPDATLRMYMAWPVGPESGEPQFNFSIGRRFELIGRL